MASAAHFIKQNMDFIHGGFRKAGEGLTPEQLHFVPEGESHSIAWVMWHGARVEDLIMQQIIKGMPQEWETGGWAERTGLPDKGFGTGQTTEQAAAIRIRDLDAFFQYVDTVSALTNNYLDNLTDEELEREVQVVRGTESVGQCINLHMITHFNGHRGEVNLIRGMMGFAPVLVNQGG